MKTRLRNQSVSKIANGALVEPFSTCQELSFAPIRGSWRGAARDFETAKVRCPGKTQNHEKLHEILKTEVN